MAAGFLYQLVQPIGRLAGVAVGTPQIVLLRLHLPHGGGCPVGNPRQLLG